MTRQVVGVIGSIIAALCCIGTPALLALLTSMGAGFLIRDAILVPLLVIFLAVSNWGIHRSVSGHGKVTPRMVAVICSVVIIVAVWFSPPLVLVGLVGLVAASVWDIYLCRASIGRE